MNCQQRHASSCDEGGSRVVDPATAWVSESRVMELQPSDEESIVRTAVADLGRRFATVDRSRIETTVRRRVGDLFAGARVKTYVGIIAERHAREELQRLGGTA